MVKIDEKCAKRTEKMCRVNEFFFLQTVADDLHRGNQICSFDGGSKIVKQNVPFVYFHIPVT